MLPDGATPTVPAAPAAVSGETPPSPTPTEQAILDADKLLDGADVEEGKKYHISATKLSEVNAMRKAFREAGIDPAQAPELIKQHRQMAEYLQSTKAAPKASETPKPAEDAEHAEARKVLRQIEPGLNAVEQMKQLLDAVPAREAARLEALGIESHEYVKELLDAEDIKLTDEARDDLEKAIIDRMRSDPKEWSRYLLGPSPLKSVERHLRAILKDHGVFGRKEQRKLSAELEAAKRAQSGLPPRVSSAGTPAPGTGGAKPPGSVKEAYERSLEVLANRATD